MNGYLVGLKEIAEVACIREADTLGGNKVVLHFDDGRSFALKVELVCYFTARKTAADNGYSLAYFGVTEKEINKAEGKKTYAGLNKDFIEKYISIKPKAEAEVLKKQYEKASEMGKFPLVRKWFLNTFRDFDMTAAKEEIEKAIFTEIAATTKKVAAMP